MVELTNVPGHRPGRRRQTDTKAASLPEATSLTTEEIKKWLEWSGQRLLAMHIASPKPRGPHSSWPEFAADAAKAYGYTPNRLRAAVPRSREIELMDEILLLPNLIKEVNVRRIINARALVTPVSNRYVYSWSRVAFMLHTSEYKVKRLHDLGLHSIIVALSVEKASTIRHSIAPFLT